VHELLLVRDVVQVTLDRNKYVEVEVEVVLHCIYLARELSIYLDL